MSQRVAPSTAASPQARRRAVPALAWALAGCAALAAASLALPFTLVFDPWGWLIWARELGGGTLDTSAGPSWKPLPVLLALPFAGAEQFAPLWWLWLARAGWLAVPVLAAALAARLARGRDVFATRAGGEEWSVAADGAVGAGGARAAGGGRGPWAAGALAGAGTLLLHDPFTAWVRQFAGGLSEPLLCALVLGAILAALSERAWLTGLLALGACLLRPETWPFAGLWAAWAVRTGRLPLGTALGGAALVPLAWFVPDLIGAGDPLAGAERAREGSGAPVAEGLEVVGRALALVPVALWLGVGWLLVDAWRGRSARREGAPTLVLAAGAFAWIAVVAALAAAGYAGLPRFMAPAAAVLCVLGAVGLVRGFKAARQTLADGGSTRQRPWTPRPLHAARRRALPPPWTANGSDFQWQRGDEGRVGAGRAPGTTLGRGLLAGLIVLVLAGCALDLGLRIARVPGELRAAHDFATGVDELFALADNHHDELLACPPLASADLYSLTALAWRLDLPLSAVTYSGRLYPRRGTAILGPNPPPGVRTQARLRAEPFAAEGRWEAYRAGPCGGE